VGFTSVRFHNFRNLSDAKIETASTEVFLVGENGQGKSNFLESLYLLSYGSSFRTRADRDLVRNGCTNAAVEGAYRSGDERHRILVEIADGKAVQVDGKRIADRKELARNTPSIIFAHDDMEYVGGRAERRRWFFDQTLSLLDPLYIDLLRRYRRVLRNRNACLRDRRLAPVRALDQQLSEVGVEIVRRRSELIRSFNTTFTPLFCDISAVRASLEISYRPSWKDSTTGRVLEALSESRSDDERLQTTTSGPHRDRYGFVTAGRDFARLASTGQRRLLALVLRVAQASYVAQHTQRRPVLLLDDVMLELDAARRERFLAALPAYEQAFFTFLPDEKFLEFRRTDTMILSVCEGMFDLWKG
jgi:DNA replication and repair protein RecF